MRLPPVFAHADLHRQRHRQGRRPLHFGTDQLAHRSHLPGRTSKTSSSCTCRTILVASRSRARRAEDAHHGDLDDVRRRALHRIVDGVALGVAADRAVLAVDFGTAQRRPSRVLTYCRSRASAIFASMNAWMPG